ncbi:hypothetical protein ACLB2K_031514 [Fragaria x ananassa]
MCANNLLPEIATYVGTTEPQTFDALVSQASNVERQVARQKSSSKIQIADKKNDSKKSVIKKGETMATFVRNERKNDIVQNNQRKNDSVKSKNDNNRVQSDRPTREGRVCLHTEAGFAVITYAPNKDCGQDNASLLITLMHHPFRVPKSTQQTLYQIGCPQEIQLTDLKIHLSNPKLTLSRKVFKPL